jgi:predicted amidohydrolase
MIDAGWKQRASAMEEFAALGYAGAMNVDNALAGTQPACIERTGRPVRVVSIGFRPGFSLGEISAWVDQEAARGADLIVLPETCRGQQDAPASTLETLDGPTIRSMAALASTHRTYIACPIDRIGGARYNSVVILDRRGAIAGVYDKIYPFSAQEWAVDPPVAPGNRACVFQADFGKVGVALCFDVNWPQLWHEFAEHGAELVIWPSAYSGGRPLQAHATQNHYSIVSATWVPDCRVYDIDGAEIMHEINNRRDGRNVSHVTIDLDRCIFHFDFHHPEKLNKLLEDHGDSIEREKWLPLEAWFVLKARRPGVSARELARQCGFEELRDYIRRSGSLIAARRTASP